MIKILFVILIISFSIWGVADHITRPPSERPAITVGDVTISATIVQEEFNRDVTRLRTILGQLSLTAEDAHRMGFMQQTLNRLAATASLDVAARAYHLQIQDESLVKIIRSTYEFKDTYGNFNRNLFQRFIESQGQSEEVYLRDLRQRLLRIQLSDPLIHAVTVPKTVMEHFKQHRYERRVAEIVTLPIETVAVLSPPDSGTLEAFYKANAETFTTPETRTISTILLTNSTVSPFVSITEEAIQGAYEESLPTLRMPETRTVEHVLLARREQAETIMSFIKNGLSLSQAAGALAHHVTPLGSLKRAEIEQMEPSLAESVFTTALDTVDGPIQSPFGWHLVRVIENIPEGIASLSLVRDQLKENLIAEKTGDVVYELSGQVEDAINGGASLEEAAQHVGLAVSVFSVDKSGLGTDGQIVSNLPPLRALLDLAFTLPEGSLSPMTESESGFFIARVDSVSPPKLHSLQAVSQKLIEKWKSAQYRKAALQKAQTVEERLRAGFSLQESARNLSSRHLHVSKPLLRTDVEDNLPPTFIAGLFNLAVNETLVDETTDSFIVGRLHSITAPVLEETTEVDLKRELTKQYTEDILAQFAASVGREFHATINSRTLEVQ